MTVGGIITCAGRATRLEPVTRAVPKAFLPVTVDRKGRGITAVSRLRDQLQAAGVSEIAVIGDGHPWFETIRDDKLRVGHAAATGELDAVIAGVALLPPVDRWIVVSCDNVFPGEGLSRFVASSAQSTHPCVGVSMLALRGLCEVEVEPAGPWPRRIERFCEKPDTDRIGLAKSGLYSIPSDALDRIAAAPRHLDRFGERSMTEAMQLLVDLSVTVSADLLAESFLDIGTPGGLHEAVQTLAGRATVTIPSSSTGPEAARDLEPSLE